jgi:hypothetical protein
LTSPQCAQTSRHAHDNGLESPYATSPESGGKRSERVSTQPTQHGVTPNPSTEPVSMLVIWVTSNRDYAEHCVTLDQAAAAVSSPGATYESLCGARFVPAPISVPATRGCQRCARLNQQRAAATCPSHTLRSALALRIREWLRA